MQAYRETPFISFLVLQPSFYHFTKVLHRVGFSDNGKSNMDLPYLIYAIGLIFVNSYICQQNTA